MVAPGFLLGAENLNSGLRASVVSPSPRFSDPFLALLLLLIRTYTTSRVEASVVFSLNPSGSSLLPGPVVGRSAGFPVGAETTDFPGRVVCSVWPWHVCFQGSSGYCVWPTPHANTALLVWNRDSHRRPASDI